MKRNLRNHFTTFWLLAITVLAALAAPSARAAGPVTIPNFSFETNFLGNGSSATNWNARGNSGQAIDDVTNGLFTAQADGTLPPPADGTNYLVINCTAYVGWVYQDIGPLQPNTTYALTIAIGQDLTGATGAGRIALINGVNQFGTTLAQTLVDNNTVGAGSFGDTDVFFSTGYQVSGDLTLLMEADTGTEIIFDNVRLVTTPLPAAATALPPTLSTPSGTVYAGTQVVVSENPGGTAPFTYQWLTDNGTAGATWTPVAGGTGATLNVDTTTLALNTAIQYQVVVSNASGSSTSSAVALTIVSGMPNLLVDTLPSSGSSDVVGSSVTFTASFDGSLPIAYQWQVDTGGGPTPIPGATNATFTLTDMQPTDTGSYSLVAANSLGTVSSSPASFTVNPVPSDVNGIVTSPANQVGLGPLTLWVGAGPFQQFTPTWVVAPTNLLQGLAPVSSTGNFQEEGAGGIPVLTDGSIGSLPAAGNASTGVATCGTVGSGAGSAIGYTLPVSITGWDLTNITVYGGWSDNGRDWSRFQVYYATTANPTNYANLLVDVDFEPVVPIGLQSATRVIITSTNGVLAKNVAGLQFFFNTLANGPENGYEGYSEFEAFGVHSAPAPVLSQNIQPATGADVVGSSVTLETAFTSLTTVTYQWYKDGVAIPGANQAWLTLNNLQLTDTSVSPGYMVKASNASGTTSSGTCAFTVNPAPGTDGSGLLVAAAQQTGGGALFTPTWTIAPGSLIAGDLPSAATYGGPGFGEEGASGVPALTDGKFGSVGSSINTTLATAGTSGGNTLTYILGSAPYGYDLTSIVSFGGWSDAGRDVEAYTVSYSTASAPTTFTTLDSVNYVPAAINVPTATRVTMSAPSGAVMAHNVVALEFNFTTPGAKNGYQGYAELQVFGAASAPFSLAPALVQDTLPGSGSDVAGNSVTFTAEFDGAPPISYQWQVGGVPILGATNSTLTLTGLTTANSGSYNVVASNAYGNTPSTPSTFTVNPVPAASNGLIAADANQTGHGGWGFAPTWTAAPGSLIAGKLPIAVGSGAFNDEGCPGVSVLTDGNVGLFYGGNSTLATGGTSAGTSVTYSLGSNPTGYELIETVGYAGWADSGRDGQGYTIAYSTVSAPTTFVNLITTSYNPSVPGSTPSADRISVYSATGGAMAHNVAAVKFTFLNVENGYSGYAELQVFGTPSAPLVLSKATISGGNLTVTSSGGIPGGAYAILTTTNVAQPLAQWTTNATGVFDSNGNAALSIPVTPGQPAGFFRIKTP